MRTPLYYGQFVWSQKSQKSYIPYLYNTDTSIKRTIGSVPVMSVLKRFNCIDLWIFCSGLKSMVSSKFKMPKLELRVLALAKSIY